MIKKTFIIFLSICLIQFFSSNSYAVEPNEILENQKQEFRARNISKNIRCMICQNQSIDESNAPLAKDLRILIRNKIKDGKKDGLWTYYFEDEKWKEGNYKDGKEDGLWTYYTKGWKWKEETYIDKNISKISHYYRMDRFYRNGQIQAEGNTNFWGSYDGKWTYYNADGTIKEVKEY